MPDMDTATGSAEPPLLLDDLIGALAPAHRQALEWFRDQVGQTTGWPEPLAPDGTFLANKAKGIHKPAGWQHALSVRQTLKGPYADDEPVQRPDGTWSYRYCQEGQDPADRDKRFTNRSLMACMADRVPVGVLRQTKGKPNVQYDVLGVALVASWDAGIFTLEGFAPTGSNALLVPAPAYVLASTEADPVPYDPANAVDAREAVLRDIKARRGQQKFRKALLDAYGPYCAITGCEVLDVLEAAHITPYLGPQTNNVTNGLLLRADLHTLFDCGLVAIDPTTLTVIVAGALRQSDYGMLHGRPIRSPLDPAAAPSTASLSQHLRDSCLAAFDTREIDHSEAA